MARFIEIDGRARTELVNARQFFPALLQARAEAARYKPRLRWERRAATEYLIAAEHRNGRRITRSLGARNERTEEVYRLHQERAQTAHDRFAALNDEYAKRIKINRAFGIGQAPAEVVAILDKLQTSGLIDKILIVGTNALFAYATEAGVHLADDVIATLDLDLLWDSRSEIAIACPDPKGLLGIIQQADPSFMKDPQQIYTLTNDRGYQVDLIKRKDDNEAGQLWPKEATDDDFWAVKVRNMDWLLSAPRIKTPIVGEDGRMALMHTVDPRALALFKLWMSKQSDRDPLKARRDALQAAALVDLIEQYLPIYPLDQMDELASLPQSVRDAGLSLFRSSPNRHGSS